MARGNDADTARRSRATRSAGLLPLVIGVASAAALTGAAYFTVDSASCGSPAQYIRHDSHVELVGGCVDGANLPAAGTPKAGGVVPGNYNP
ncbi:hypothetical protein [Amycolatopsis sp. cmx-4-68]|uniref:hypothetical protein n=1 Tax=Amycolatopsis sp. cmx-4-68 TaxID=2790938 RepID=UPI00397BD015